MRGVFASDMVDAKQKWVTLLAMTVLTYTAPSALIFVSLVHNHSLHILDCQTPHILHRESIFTCVNQCKTGGNNNLKTSGLSSN